ncbi:hypothetical protein B9Z19DRAFT_88328 [Tuber borchii]|uniref:Uncharacterized protein n=1 Tax=Tuber borchii TaxID=42251 RepID=A0A2T6ZS17_TUBBO|nr:hypothetical protein B9Z19DRAFT_88328 [Tuber borchii]
MRAIMASILRSERTHQRKGDYNCPAGARIRANRVYTCPHEHYATTLGDSPQLYYYNIIGSFFFFFPQVTLPKPPSPDRLPKVSKSGITLIYLSYLIRSPDTNHHAKRVSSSILASQSHPHQDPFQHIRWVGYELINKAARRRSVPCGIDNRSLYLGGKEEAFVFSVLAGSRFMAVGGVREGQNGTSSTPAQGRGKYFAICRCRRVPRV